MKASTHLGDEPIPVYHECRVHRASTIALHRAWEKPLKVHRRTAIAAGVSLAATLLFDSAAFAATTPNAERTAAGTLSGIIQLFTQPVNVRVHPRQSKPAAQRPTSTHALATQAPPPPGRLGLQRASSRHRRARV